MKGLPYILWTPLLWNVIYNGMCHRCIPRDPTIIAFEYDLVVIQRNTNSCSYMQLKAFILSNHSYKRSNLTWRKKRRAQSISSIGEKTILSKLVDHHEVISKSTLRVFGLSSREGVNGLFVFRRNNA